MLPDLVHLVNESGYFPAVVSCVVSGRDYIGPQPEPILLVVLSWTSGQFDSVEYDVDFVADLEHGLSSHA